MQLQQQFAEVGGFVDRTAVRHPTTVAPWRRSAWAGALFAGCVCVGGCAAPEPHSTASPDRTFACGTAQLRCDRGTQYCETLKTDAPELPSNFACLPLPIACQATALPTAKACGCFAPGTRGDFCSAVDGPGGRAFYRTQVGGH